MQVLYKVIDEKIKKEYEEINSNQKKLDKIVKETCNKFGIEANEYRQKTDVLQMNFTENDYDKFKDEITEEGYFKNNSAVHKFFIQRTKDIDRVRKLSTLDFGIFIPGCCIESMFKYENELYFYIESFDCDFEKGIEGMEEADLLIYYDFLDKEVKKLLKGE